MIAAVDREEQERLEALQELELTNTDAGPEFDELVALAATVCDAPMGALTLIEQHRQLIKAATGLPTGESTREVAFCDYTIRQKDLLMVEDTKLDGRFANNPFVTSGPEVRFYAGMPVFTPEGHAVGALCVMDRKPRTLSRSQIAALKILARDVNVRFELRLERKKLERAVREAEQARAQLYATEERFRLFMDNSPLVSHIKDEQGRIVFYNRLFTERFGIDRDEWIGKCSYDLLPPEEAKVVKEADAAVLSGLTLRAVRQTVRDTDGSLTHWKSYKFPLQSSDGTNMLGVVGVEITEDLRREEELHRYQEELETANRLLQDLAATDALTRLPNRRAFDERLKIEFSQARRKMRTLSVLMLDLDNFKRRNDKYGHAEGDATLQQLGELLKQTARIPDLPARYGGEEFVVLLPETDEAQALLFAERLRKAIHAHPWPHEPVTASVGVAALHPSTRDEQRLLALADEALYAAKRAGKDRAVGYGAYYQQVLREISGSKPLQPAA